MAIHILRDYLSPATTMPSSSMYYSTIFMFHVLRFTQVGQTNFNLSGSLMVASGISASINLGVTGSFSTVGLPFGGGNYQVTAADVGRILALRSDLFPRKNSGIFKITSVLTGSNRLNIEYRAVDDPPVESGTLGWAIFANENTIQGTTPYSSTGGTPTGAAGYKSRGAYSGKRIILQSPHTSSWQVRFCQESTTDRTNNAMHWSVAPGFNGDASGDFPSRSFDASVINEHLHGPMWFDVSNGNYQGTGVCFEPQNGDTSAAQVRYYGWGDDVTGSCVFMYRNVANYSDGWFSFGMSEDDEPAPPRASQKLFAFGRSSVNNAIPGVGWGNGPALQAKWVGVAFGLNLQPVNAVWAVYDYIGGNGGQGPRGEGVGTDNTILGATELQKVDIWAGTAESGYDGNSSWPAVAVLQWDPRRLGSMPMARIGRTNFGNWTLTTDVGKLWFHIGGVYMPWSGSAIFA